MSASLQLRNLREEEMPKIIDMAAREGWNPGRHDATAFFQADSQGFFVGEVDGVPVAYISAVNYGQCYGFVGLYIVDPAYRGQGYGYAIWAHALARLGNMPCGLDGVPAQIENYKKSGFTYAFRQMRLAAPAMAVSSVSHPLVERLAAQHIEAVMQYDASVFGTPRQSFVKAWLAMPGAQAFCVSNCGIITGYAVIRQCVEGFKVGPLFADNDTVAEQLFLACHGAAPVGATVFIDMPEINPATAAWTVRYRLELVFETARMYKNGIPSFPVGKIFGVTTFELG